jgi:glycosyltransferase involved in cell wall biosynthesis
MKTVLIFLPTYNRLPQLKVCLERLLDEVRGSENDVAIHISDNGSTDGTAEYLAAVSHPILTVSRNPTNIGLPPNILKAHDLAHVAEFTWAVGDDDVVLGGSIRRLVDAVKANSDADLMFLNTAGYDKRRQAELTPLIAGRGYKVDPDWGPTKSTISRTYRTTVAGLFDPRVDAVFFGSLMCYAWRSARVSNRLSPAEISHDFSQPKACYHVAMNYLYSLSPCTPAIHFAEPFTVNFWHEGTAWGREGHDLAVTQGLGIMLYEAIRLGYVKTEQRAAYFAHYMSIASPGYRRFIDEGTFGDRLVHFHPQLAEMLLRYGTSTLYPRPKALRQKLADASPSKLWSAAARLLARIVPGR